MDIALGEISLSFLNTALLLLVPQLLKFMRRIAVRRSKRNHPVSSPTVIRQNAPSNMTSLALTIDRLGLDRPGSRNGTTTHYHIYEPISASWNSDQIIRLDRLPGFFFSKYDAERAALSKLRLFGDAEVRECQSKVCVEELAHMPIPRVVL